MKTKRPRGSKIAVCAETLALELFPAFGEVPARWALDGGLDAAGEQIETLAFVDMEGGGCRGNTACDCLMCLWMTARQSLATGHVFGVLVQRARSRVNIWDDW